MRSLITIGCVIVVSACASQQSNTRAAATATTPNSAAASTNSRTMTAAEWETARTTGTWELAELPQVGERREVSMIDEPSTAPPPAPGTLRLTSCMPGGQSEAIVRERATDQYWRLRSVGGLHIPQGVSISATRCFQQDHQLPEGRAIAGTLTVSYPSHVGTP